MKNVLNKTIAQAKEAIAKKTFYFDHYSALDLMHIGKITVTLLWFNPSEYEQEYDEITEEFEPMPPRELLVIVFKKDNRGVNVQILCLG